MNEIQLAMSNPDKQVGNEFFTKLVRGGALEILQDDARFNSKTVERLHDFARDTTFAYNGVKSFRTNSSDKEIIEEHNKQKQEERILRLNAKKAVDTLAYQGRLNSTIGGILERDLEILDPETYKVLYQDKSGWRDFIPTKQITAPGATTYRYKFSDRTSQVKVTSEAVSSVPMVNANRKFYDMPVLKALIGYEVTLDEMKAYAFAGQPLESELVEDVLEAYDINHYNSVLKGLSEGGTQLTTGLLNNANFANDASAATFAASIALGTQAGLDAIYQEFVDFVNAARTDTKNLFWTPQRPGKIGLPLAQYLAISTTFYSFNKTMNLTLKDAILQNVEGIASIEPILDCAGAGIGAGAGNDVMVGWIPDKKVMEYIITQGIEWLPMERHIEIMQFPSNMKLVGMALRNATPNRYLHTI